MNTSASDSSSKSTSNSRNIDPTIGDLKSSPNSAKIEVKVEDMDSKESKESKEKPQDITRAESMRKQFASGGPEGSSSLEEQHCCTKMAFSVVHKAWEGAKKAIPSKSQKKEAFPRSCGEKFDPMNTGRFSYIDSDVEPPTEYSYDYTEDNNELNRESVFQLRPGVFYPLETKSCDQHSGSEATDSDRAMSEEGDFDRLKTKYISDNVIPEETEEEMEMEKENMPINSSVIEKRKNLEENKRLRKNRKLMAANIDDDDDSEDSRSDRKHRKKGSPKIEKYAKCTSEEVINLAKLSAAEEVLHRNSYSDADDERSLKQPEFVNSTKEQELYRVKPRINLPKHDSQDSTDALESFSCDIPTLTITEDELEDTSCGLSEATLRSEDEMTEVAEENIKPSKSKAEKLKSKVKEFGGKVKEIFGKHDDKKGEKRHPDENAKDIDNSAEDAAEKRKADLALKREQSLKLRAEEKAKMEEERKQKAEEAKKRLQADLLKREEELLKKEEDLRKKAEEQKKKEEEKLRKEEEKRKKEEEKKRKEEEKKRLKEQKEEEAKRKKAEEQRKKMESSIAKIAELEKKVQQNEEMKKNNDKEKFVVKYDDFIERATIDINLKQDEFRFTTKTDDIISEDTVTEAVYPSQETAVEEEVFENVETVEVSIPKNDEHEYCNVEVQRRVGDNVQTVTGFGSASPSELTIVEPLFVPLRESPPKVVEIESEEEAALNVESEGDFEVAPKNRNKRKIKRKLRDTKKKLKVFKEKALESLPSMQQIKSKVKDFFPKSGPPETVHDYERVGPSVPREQRAFDEYKQRYPDSEGEFFSDSELIDARKAKSRGKERTYITDGTHLYEEVAASESGPLRPPRRYEKSQRNTLNTVPATSEPAISKRIIATPKYRRIPPPRPPLPENFSSYEPSLADTELVMENISLDRDFESMGRIDRIPAHVYYKTVRKNCQERNLERLADLISRSTPNLQSKQSVSASELYAKPKPRRPERPPLPKQYPVYEKTKADDDRMEVIAWKPPTGKQVVCVTHYEPVGEGGPPRRPPRMRRRFATFRTPSAMSRPEKAQLATDPLYWKAFAWKTGRCRSLTELYLRKKTLPENNGHKLENTAGYRLTIKYCVPPRPPLPPGVQVDNEPIYSSIDKSGKKPKSPPASVPEDQVQEKMKDRPLPPPPVPPRPKSKSLRGESCESLPLSLNVGRTSVSVLQRSVSPTGIELRDAAVSTTDNGLFKLYEKEVQTSFEDLTDNENTLDGKQSSLTKSPKVMDVNANFAKNNQASETTEKIVPKECASPLNEAIIPPDDNLNVSDALSLTSTLTVGSYIDAEEDYPTEDEDQDTFADIESIGGDTSTSQFVSFSETTHAAHKSCKKKQSSESERSRIAQESQSEKCSEAGSKSGCSSKERRKAREDRRHIVSEESEDTDDLLRKTRNLQQEIKQVLQRKASKDDVSDSDW